MTTFLVDAEREFRRLKELADAAIAQVPREELDRRLGEETNSVAVLMKHLAGNLRSRWTDFLTSDGEKPDRDRDGEFEIVPEDTPEELEARWEHGWTCLFDALSALEPADLERAVRIRGEELSVLQAIVRQLVHYGYHVGQIVLLARHAAGASWKTLSIPRGGSRTFNAAPRSYLEPRA